MPTSHPYQIDDILQLILETGPHSLLDIGVGFGKYGVLAREYLELWNGYKHYKDWNHRIDGIEVFSSYMTPLHDFIYNQIYIGNALEVLPKMEIRYDLILLIDVLEHFEKEEGFRILELSEQKARNLIISTPLDIEEQADSFNNPHERHQFQWRKSHLKILKNAFFISNRKSILCYSGEDALRVKKRFLRRKRSTLYRETLPRLAATLERLKKFKRSIFPKPK